MGIYRERSSLAAKVSWSVVLTWVVALVIFCAAFFIQSGGWTTTSERELSAARNARLHAQALGWNISGVACSGADSDANGYVTCALAFSDGRSKSVLCGYDKQVAPFGQNTGCKDPTPISIQPQ